MTRAIVGKIVLAGLLAGAVERAEAGERHDYVLEEVRVIYSVEGESAVPTEDLDDNGTPDRVEDVALQVWAAREFYCEHLGYPDPLESDRFGKADCIQVSIHSKSKIHGLNGVAYRVAQRAKPVKEGNPNDRALALAIANTVDPIRNPTPAHEFFHLIQYGATYLSNGWFLEGMARWSEAVWRESGTAAAGLARPARWGLKDGKTEELFGMRYDAAAAYWNPLAASFEQEARFRSLAKEVPESLRALEYSDGTPVIQKTNPAGAALMKDVLKELAEVDDRVQRELGYNEWTLASQGAPENNPYLFEAVREVLRRHGMVGE